MALSHSPKIVTSGLVFCLDAANTKSYTGSGTTWSDLSGSNYNSVLTNSPVYTSSGAGSYFTFDGVNDFSISSGFQTFGNNMTWEAWVYCAGNVSTYNMFMGRYLPYFSFYAGDRLYFSNIIGGVQQTIQTAGTLSLNTWYYTAFTTSYSGSNTTMNIYTNGVLTQTGTFAGAQGQYSTGFMIGDGNNGSAGTWYPFGGRISAVKVYNRTLSAGEILQNFAASRGRYRI
jgi:hypothetical protein